MFKFSFPNKLDKKVPLLLPVCSDQIKTVPKKLLNGLSKKQTEAVRAALRKGVPDDGLLPVYSGDATVLLMLLAKEKSLKTRSVRETSSQIFSAARKYKIDGLTILTGTLNDELVRAMREGIVIGSYEYNDWKGVIHKEKAKKQTTLKSVSFTGNKTAGESKRLLQLQKSIALTKDLINCPPKTATPSYLEKKN